MRFSSLGIIITGASLLGAFTPTSAFDIVARYLPDCATQCLASADYGPCSVSDTACLCNSASFISSTSACVATTCKGDDLQTVIRGGQAFCASVGVTLSHSPSATNKVPMCTQPPATTNTSKGRATSTRASASSAARRVHVVNTFGLVTFGLGVILLWFC